MFSWYVLPKDLLARSVSTGGSSTPAGKSRHSAQREVSIRRNIMLTIFGLCPSSQSTLPPRKSSRRVNLVLMIAQRFQSLCPTITHSPTPRPSRFLAPFQDIAEPFFAPSSSKAFKAASMRGGVEVDLRTGAGRPGPCGRAVRSNQAKVALRLSAPEAPSRSTSALSQNLIHAGVTGGSAVAVAAVASAAYACAHTGHAKGRDKGCLIAGSKESAVTTADGKKISRPSSPCGSAANSVGSTGSKCRRLSRISDTASRCRFARARRRSPPCAPAVWRPTRRTLQRKPNPFI